MRVRGVQNGGKPASRECAPLAGPANAGEKRGQVESMEPENTSQSSQTSQYSQTNCAGRVSPANAGRVTGVQNGGLQRTERTGEKSRTPISPISPIGPMKKYADMVSKMRLMGVQNGESQLHWSEKRERQFAGAVHGVHIVHKVHSPATGKPECGQ